MQLKALSFPSEPNSFSGEYEYLLVIWLFYSFPQSYVATSPHTNFCKVCKNLTGAGGRRRRGGYSDQPTADAAGYRQPAGLPFRQPAVPFNPRISRCPSISGPFDVQVRVVYVESCRPPAKKPEFGGSLRICVQTTRTWGELEPEECARMWACVKKYLSL